ncbi:MAG: glycosyltransferase family 39 protein [Candidatus Promineifilaceae bacterium]
MIERIVQSKSRRMTVFAIGLLIFFLLAVHTAVVKSPTADEVIHLLRGRTVWQTADMSLQGQHTPFSHWLIGMFFFTEPTAPDVEQLPSWASRNSDQLISEFLWESGVDVDRLLFLGRLPIILAGLLLGAVVVSWVGKRRNRIGQLVVLCLFAFSPNILAFSALATTDLVAAATTVWVLFALWCYWQKPSRTLWLLTGVALGLALGAKLTAVFLLPVTLLLCYFSAKGEKWWKPFLVWLSFLPVAGLVMWALYGFEFGAVAGFPLSLPAPTYVDNFLAVEQHIERGHDSFLLGQISNQGWWYYFIAAFLVKMPTTVLLLLVGTIIYIVWRRQWWASIYFWLPVGTLFLAASVSGLNIGYRHILVVVPLTWLLVSEAIPWIQSKRFGRWLLAVGLGLYGVVSIWQEPDYLAFFNLLVGGSSNGYQYLGDSNIDWGQDLELLVQYVDQNQDDPLYVSYFGAADPDYYGLEKPQLFDEDGNPLDFAPANPAPGRYALSVNLVQSGTDAQPDLFDWFRGREPDDNLGYSILIYDVPGDMDGEWVAHCFDPDPLMDEPTAELYVGRTGLRHVYFDCRHSWLLPAGGQPGWYILPSDLTPAFSEMVFPEMLRPVYQSVNRPGFPAYAIYYWPGSADAGERLTQQSAPVVTLDGAAVELPITAEDIVRFRGGFASESLWGSAWEVMAMTDRFFSVQLHLYGDAPPPLVADGLGYSIVQWQPGDIFIQLVQAEEPGGSLDGRYLETSLYDLNSGERLVFENQVSGVRVLGD